MFGNIELAGVELFVMLIFTCKLGASICAMFGYLFLCCRIGAVEDKAAELKKRRREKERSIERMFLLLLRLK